MINIQITTSADKTQQALIRMSEGFKDLSIPLKRSGEYMVSSVNRNFDAQGRPVPWKPLSSMTIAMRRKGGGMGSPLILQDTGTLRRSITYELMGIDSVRVGTNLPYASKLQFGGVNVIPAHREKVKSFYRIQKGKRVQVKEFERNVPSRTFTIPARPFIIFNEEDKVVIQKIFSDYVREVIKEKE
jgi:phage gpG-like protein